MYEAFIAGAHGGAPLQLNDGMWFKASPTGGGAEGASNREIVKSSNREINIIVKSWNREIVQSTHFFTVFLKL